MSTLEALEEFSVYLLEHWKQNVNHIQAGVLYRRIHTLVRNDEAELARLRKIEKAVTEWKESIDWHPDRECFCIHCKLYFALEGSEE